MTAIDAAKREPVQGELRVLIDLGIWMLLRFVPAAGDHSARTAWLPVQRSGLQDAWHALRCAVYSPRLAPGASPGSSVAADPHPPE
jgi:hypothetical protein